MSGQPGTGRGTVWAAGLLVALGAGVATAHGLYEVALAARVPAPIAWLYPLITDGLALVAYAATARLTHRGRRYAWTVVVLAAGLSGLAQATYLAGGVAAAPTALRFGVGAWPAVAAAIVAHLVHLLGAPAAALTRTSQPVADRRPVQAEPAALYGQPESYARSDPTAYSGQARTGGEVNLLVQPSTADGVAYAVRSSWSATSMTNHAR